MNANQATSIIVAALGLTLAGCGREAIETTKTDNQAISVDRLFTKDGCTVYRFSDAGRYRYFARCAGTASMATWDESCGKDCSHPVDVPTAMAPPR